MYCWRLRALLLAHSFHLTLTYTSVISAGESFDFVQTQSIQTFEYLPAASQSAHLLVEVFFDNDFQVPNPTVLIASREPVTDFQAVTSAEYVDYDGWFEGKLYHFLQFGADAVAAQTLYIVVYSNVTFPSQVAQYHISMTAQSSPICPNGCFDHGHCNLGLCQCADGYAQPACDTSLVTLKDKQTMIVEENVVVYFYVTMEEMRGNQVVFDWTSGFPEVLAKQGMCGYRTALPSLYEFKSRFDAETDHGSYVVGQEDSVCENGKFWAFRLTQSKNQVSELIVLTARIASASSSSTPNTMMIVIVLVGSLVAIAWSAFLAYKLRSCYKSRRLKVMDSTSVSLERMRKMCPKKDYKSLPKAFTEQPCPICLEEFRVESDVRVLPCQHVYHSRCIDQWFLSNSICCFCKIDIFKEAVRKLLPDPSELADSHLNETSQDSHLHVVELA